MALKHLRIMAFSVFGVIPISFATQNQVSEIPAPEAVTSYKEYWGAFDNYEAKILKDGKNKYHDSWANIKYSKNKNNLEYIKKELEHLEKARKAYNEHLEEYEYSQNRPYVYLNLAQILVKISDLKFALGEKSTEDKKIALEILGELEDIYKDFSKREQTLYLKGVIYSSLGEDKNALRAWKRLSKVTPKTIYGVHALIAIGDQLFKNERPEKSLLHYKSALNKLAKVTVADEDFEKLRIQYRIIWAAYRSANLKETISTGINLLIPGRHFHNTDIKSKIEADAIQLIGDSLYENNNTMYTKSTLQRRTISRYASAIALRVVTNYLAVKAYNRVIDISEYTLNTYPAAETSPDLLNIMANAYDKKGDQEIRIKNLERLALFLPSKSLWRTRHKNKYHLIQEMEKKSESAAIVVADYYYQKGQSTDRSKFYETALTYYNLLLQHNPNGKKSDTFRLRITDCYYLAGQYEKASKNYEELLKSRHTDPDIQKTAAYQLLLTREKIWRKHFVKIENKGQKATKHPVVITKLVKLEQAVELFVNRFPSNLKNNNLELAVDALLLGAAANRDHKKYVEAIKYWQRVLLANPTNGQRSIAVRGIIQAKVESGSPKDIVEACLQYLKPEKEMKKRSTLSSELKGVLSHAIFQYMEQLNNEGKYKEAGILGVQMAQEFKTLPDRAKIFRDGAYMLAISGEWSDAKDAAEKFLSENIKSHRPDMLYLLARSKEYLLDFHNAAKSYYELAKKYKSHRKARVGAEKSEVLAVYDSDYLLAGQAAMLGALLDKNLTGKTKLYKRAFDHFTKHGAHKSSLRAARKTLEIAKKLDQRMPAQLLVANALMQNNEKKRSLNLYQQLSKKAAINRSRLNSEVFSSIYGESNYYLGEEARSKLNNYNVFNKGGRFSQVIRQKMKYLEIMVNYFNLAAKSNNPIWTAKSRFLIATEAQRLADIFSSYNRKKDLRSSHKTTLANHIERLTTIARTQHSSNLLAQSRQKRAYINNPWVEKSKIKLVGMTDVKTSFTAKEISPAVVSLNIPQKWSL